MKGLLFTYICFFSLVVFTSAQKNDNISLQGKSVMYRMGGKVFYGRPIKNLPFEQQQINVADSAAMMKIKKEDAFGHIMEKNLEPIADTEMAKMDAKETDMKVRKTDIFGSKEQRNLNPDKIQKMSIVESVEEARMHVRAADAFGNIVYENLNPINRQEVLLLDEKETVMRITTTDAFGNFTFENLDPEKNYKIKFKFTDNPGLPEEDLVIANFKGEIYQTFKINGHKDFTLSPLAGDSTQMRLMEAIEVKMEEK